MLVPLERFPDLLYKFPLYHSRKPADTSKRRPNTYVGIFSKQENRRRRTACSETRQETKLNDNEGAGGSRAAREFYGNFIGNEVENAMNFHASVTTKEINSQGRQEGRVSIGIPFRLAWPLECVRLWRRSKRAKGRCAR